MTKLRRSMLFVPGANAAMLSNTFIYQPDSIMFNLEDSVALREKDTARMLVFHALQHPMYQEMETVVRVNPLDSEFGIKDLNAVVRGGAKVVRLPKTDNANDVIEMEKVIEQSSVHADVKWVARVCWRRLKARKASTTRLRLPLAHAA